MTRVRKLIPALAALTLGLALATPQSEIAAKAAELRLGAARSDTPSPLQTPSPRNDGYYQGFAGGYVYWRPQSGAHAIVGTIFQKWVAEGYEQGHLGFPLTDEQPCKASNPADRSQIFDGGRIVWTAATNTATVYNAPTTIGEGGNCTAPVSVYTGPLVLQVPAFVSTRAHVRVTILGFTCHTWTDDDPLEGDGKGDEIFIRSQVRLLNRAGAVTFSSDGQSAVYGDVNGHPERILAGTRHGNLTGPRDGGIQSGDSVPTSQPWTLSSLPESSRDPNHLPLTVFDGDVDTDDFTLVMVPSLWEWDGGGSWVQDLFNTLLTNGSDITRGAVSIAGSERDLSSLDPALHGVANIINTLGGQPGDRPVGVQEIGDNRSAYQPTVLAWSARGIQLASQMRVNSLPQGVQAISFRDDSKRRGDYTLYVRYEYTPR